MKSNTLASESTRTMGYVEAINNALSEAMTLDKDVILLGEDIGHFGGMFRATEGLLKKFGQKRVIDTPISESGFVGLALGAALRGKRPVVELMFFDFSLVAADQILNQIAKTTYMCGGVPVPLVIRTQGGGYKGAAAQHSQMLEALYVHIPGLKVVCPSTPADARSLLLAAIADNSPVLFIEHKQCYPMKGEVPVQPEKDSLGTAKVVREGSDAVIFSYSYTVHLALEAAENLAKNGQDVAVVDLRSLNPLDWNMIENYVKKTHRVLIAHESHARCGVGADLAAQIQEKLFDELDGPILRVCGADTPIPFAKILEDIHLPSVERIQNEVLRLLK